MPVIMRSSCLVTGPVNMHPFVPCVATLKLLSPSLQAHARAQTAPSGYSAAACVGSSRDRLPPEEAVIRIHFFLLCALVHCLSSSVQCNQVNERACNEAIRCSLLLRARRSVLSWRTLALGARVAASGQRH